MSLPLRLALVIAGIVTATARADESSALATPANRIAGDDPEWGKFSAELRAQTAVTADFTELRWFTFKTTPTVLKGEARISADRGLSLHYLGTEEQVVIVDAKGTLLRTSAGDRTTPSDPRSDAANFALLHLLRLDLALLSDSFELYGRHSGANWTLALVPRDSELRRTLGAIAISGMGAAIHHIEFRHSATQRVEITMEAPQTKEAFTPDELHRYFR